MVASQVWMPIGKPGKHVSEVGIQAVVQDLYVAALDRPGRQQGQQAGRHLVYPHPPVAKKWTQARGRGNTRGHGSAGQARFPMPIEHRGPFLPAFRENEKTDSCSSSDSGYN